MGSVTELRAGAYVLTVGDEREDGRERKKRRGIVAEYELLPSRLEFPQELNVCLDEDFLQIRNNGLADSLCWDL